jgi:hypothetical protein
MGAGQEAPLLKCGVDLGGRRSIGRRANGGFNVRDQVREVIFAGFREMHFVADLLRGVIAGRLRFEVIR